MDQKIKLVKVYVVNKKDNKILIDGQSFITEDVDRLSSNLCDDLIRKDAKLDRFDLHVHVSRITNYSETTEEE